MAPDRRKTTVDGLELHFEAKPYSVGKAAVDVGTFLKERGVNEHLKCEIVVRELAMDLSRHLQYRIPTAHLDVYSAADNDPEQPVVARMLFSIYEQEL